MTLPEYEYENIESELAEFNDWITPSLLEIDETEKFQQEIKSIKNSMDAIAEITSNLPPETFSISLLSVRLIDQAILLDSKADIKLFFEEIFSLLFLVTGKSDNNIKCQYPVYLVNKKKINKIPDTKKRKLVYEDVPRTIKAKSFAFRLANIIKYKKELHILLESYLELILSSENYILQLYYTCNSYYELEKSNKGVYLISALVAFKVKGSVSATIGHIPEDILRQRMEDWGLQPDFDFNLQDIAIIDLLSDVKLDEEEKKTAKSRAYDFILPYKSRDIKNKIFIQCQFYAGDSGSVSHKNVDQTVETRRATIKKYPDAIFLEYLDGAGYFSSLNGDLKHLLRLPTTNGFFQIRSSAIKLRRELQQINFLTLLEIEHAIFLAGNKKEQVFRLLSRDYSQDEIETAIALATNNNMLESTDDELYIVGDRREIARRYLLLDGAAVYGKKMSQSETNGCILIPGFGSCYGIKQNELVHKISEITQGIQDDWDRNFRVLDDIQWLLDNGFWSIG